MTNLPDMAGAAAEIKLGDNTYRMRPLSIDDFAEFERYAGDEPIRRAVRNLESVSPELQAKMLETAQKEATESRSRDFWDYMTSIEGICFVVWLGLRREQPDLSLSDIAQKITLDQLPYIQQRLDDINGFSSPSHKRANHPRKKSKSR